VKNIDLYHLRSNPSVMVPRLFLSATEMPHMRLSAKHVVRTLEREFRTLCLELAEHEAKVVIQELPEQAHWKVHVIKDGKVGTSTTMNHTLVDATREAWSQHKVKPPEEHSEKDTLAVC
jgi:hypothetical protein